MEQGRAKRQRCWPTEIVSSTDGLAERRQGFVRKVHKLMTGHILGLGIGLAALGVGIGLGMIGNGAMQGMSRQPEAIGKIQVAMLIALAFVELVFLLAVFAAPFLVK